MGPRTLAAMVGGMLALTGCGGDAGSRSPTEPPALRLSSGGLHVAATYLGGTRVSDEGNVRTAVSPQIDPGRARLGRPLAVEDAAVLRALVDRPARERDAHIEPAGRGAERAPVRETGAARRWTLDLPDELPARARLVVSVGLGSDGDALFAAALRRRAPRFQFERCPRPWRGRPEPARTIAVASLVGRSVREAERRAATVGCTVRVLERDGQALPGTMDLTNARVNVAVRDGRVTRTLSVA